jgi:hypothetical protein
MNEVDILYKEYNNLIKKWTDEINALKSQLYDVKLSEYKKCYIRGQIKAIEEMRERLKDTSI